MRTLKESRNLRLEEDVWVEIDRVAQETSQKCSVVMRQAIRRGLAGMRDTDLIVFRSSSKRFRAFNPRHIVTVDLVALEDGFCCIEIGTVNREKHTMNLNMPNDDPKAVRTFREVCAKVAKGTL